MHTTNALLQQLDPLTLQARGDTSKQSETAGNFSQLLTTALDSLSDYQHSAADKAKSIELGRGEVGINDLMVTVQKATISLQLGVQVRNKMIAAYNDVMNMSV